MDLQTLQTRQGKIAHEASQLLALADRETRALTADEEKQYDAHLKSLEDVGKQIARFKSDASTTERLTELESMGSKDGGPMVVGRLARREKSLGEQFVESAAGKWLIENKATRAGRWTSPGVELKATILEETSPIAVPEYRPGIVAGPTPRLAVAQLFAPGTTGTNAVGFFVEKTATNAAAPVLEGGTKPESTLTFAPETSAVRKVATWIPASDEILEDVPTMRSYIDARLRYFVRAKLDDQLLNGDGVAPNLLGMLHLTGLAPAIAQGTGTAADAILTQISAIEADTGSPADAVVLHPDDWLFLQLSKDADGNYQGGGPFAAPTPPTIWKLPVAITKSMTKGTALVGAFKMMGQVWVHGGIRVEATNSHADFFIKDLQAIRAEIRAALTVYMPQAFGLVTGLAAPTPPA